MEDKNIAGFKLTAEQYSKLHKFMLHHSAVENKNVSIRSAIVKLIDIGFESIQAKTK